ncbi:MAG TPA: hypothetical protein VJ732_16455 [Bryobacteraceae bacterium]|nr:hypothetical protein [Bryobacteraceae bacterium]
MKRILACLILAALPAAAQWRHFGSEPVSPTGFFGVGFTAPVNPAAGNLDTGWNLSGGIGFTTNYVGVMLDAMVTSLGVSHAALLDAGFPEGRQRYWAVTVDPIFHVNRRGPVDFYVTGGGGLYSQITDFRVPAGFGGYHYNHDLTSSYSIYKPGVDAGAGFAFNVGYRSPVKIFAEARFHHMFLGSTGVSFIPVTLGVRF